MDENILKFRVGIFVVIAMCILGILIFLNSEGWVPQYNVYLKTRSAPGVTQGTPIRKNGILIGRVNDVKPIVEPDGEEVVLVEMAINEGVNVYENETCSIGSDSILGDAAIEFVLEPGVDRGQLVAAGSDYPMARVEIAPNPMKLMGDLTPKLSKTLDAIQSAGLAVDETADGIQQLTDTIQFAFQDEESDFKAMIKDFRTMTVKAQAALDDVDRFFVNANNIIDDPELKWQLKQALLELPVIMQEITVTIRDARDTVRSFGTIPDGVNDNLDNMKVFTESLKKQGPEVLEQINTSLKNVDELVAQVKGFTGSLDMLKNNEGTLAKLIKDPALYNSLLKTAETVQKEIFKIEPIINDVRTFADAIARDPGSIGVRGAVRNRSPEKSGYKGTAGRDGGLFNFRQ